MGHTFRLKKSSVSYTRHSLKWIKRYCDGRKNISNITDVVRIVAPLCLFWIWLYSWNKFGLFVQAVQTNTRRNDILQTSQYGKKHTMILVLFDISDLEEMERFLFTVIIFDKLFQECQNLCQTFIWSTMQSSVYPCVSSMMTMWRPVDADWGIKGQYACKCLWLHACRRTICAFFFKG